MASMEWLSLYVNLETRKVTEFENEKIEIMFILFYKIKIILIMKI